MAGASSSVGSNIFALISFIVICILVLLLLRHYLPLRSTPGYLIFPVFLALALPCSIILLVPIDLASADGGSSRGVWLPERAVLVTWRITYWLTFLLTWFLLPLLGEFCDSGDRDSKSRLIYALRSNAQYWILYLGFGIAGLVYFIYQNGFHGESIKSLIMALAYAWGLVLAIGLMGHGLVSLPRRLFINANVSRRLKRLQAQAPKTKDKLDDAKDELGQLENTVVQLHQRKNGTSRHLQDWIDELADTTALPGLAPGIASAVGATHATIPAVVTERYMAELTRKLKRARHRKARFESEWSHLCLRAQDTQKILDAASSKKLDFGRETPGNESLLGRLKFITPSMRYQLYSNVFPWLRIALSVFLATASVMVIWSEIVRSFAPKISFIGITVVHHPSSDHGKVGFGGQLIAAAWLLYMDACALYAVADVKVWGNRALVKRQTYAESACWYSLQVAKLTVPLSYNFITMLPPSVYEETSFFKFLGMLINLTPLGEGFSNFFPCFLLIPVLATMFNLYGKAQKVIGFGVLEDESEDNPSGSGGWLEGRALINRELQTRGTDGAAVGLPSRGASLDLERQVGAATAGTSAPPLPHYAQRDATPPTHVQTANRQFNSITNLQEAPEDEGPRYFYQDFTERVRNTFESADFKLPKIQAPKWMQNDQRDRSDGPAGGFSRWFGGRPEEGRLQL